ncbi:MAG: phosphogluconate dehydrogenase (NAD(+)-dependent, decarboxylating) [Armatimonadota bacterium]
MKLGMFGLGRMGGSMALRLIRGGHEVMGWSRTEGTVNGARERGVPATTSVEEAVATLQPPRVAWLMVPAGDPVDAMIRTLAPLLDCGDIIVDGGNSRYTDTMRRAEELAARGLRMVDVGTSGGVWGLEEGYSLMVGGEPEAVEQVRPLLECLAPGRQRGWARVGPSGAGHFVKMVHNGIEYGMMQAYAEGFAIMRRKHQFDLDLHRVAQVWCWGSVIRSWLLELIADALKQDQELAEVAPFVEDSGEGRWTVFEAIDLDESAPVITLALLRRLASRDQERYADRLLAVMRRQFGAHEVKQAEEGDG